MRLEGKTAVVSGGANGIGAGCIRRLAKEGANVVIADIDDAAGNALAEDIGTAAIYVRSDVSQRASVEALFEATLHAFGAVDILVNNAAFVHKPGVIANFLEYSDDSWQRTLDVNLSGMFYCSQTAARLMAKRGAGGVIINVSSGGASRAHRHMFGYDTSKGGIEAATRVMALDLAALNIRGQYRSSGQHTRRPWQLRRGFADPAFGRHPAHASRQAGRHRRRRRLSCFGRRCLYHRHAYLRRWRHGCPTAHALSRLPPRFQRVRLIYRLSFTADGSPGLRCNAYPPFHCAALGVPGGKELLMSRAATLHHRASRLIAAIAALRA